MEEQRMTAKLSSISNEEKRLLREWKGWEKTHIGSKVTESSGIWLHKLMLADAEHLIDFKGRLAVFKILTLLLSLQTSQIIYLSTAPQNSNV